MVIAVRFKLTSHIHQVPDVSDYHFIEVSKEEVIFQWVADKVKVLCSNWGPYMRRRFGYEDISIIFYKFFRVKNKSQLERWKEQVSDIRITFYKKNK